MHVGALGQLHLHGVDMLRRPAVVAGDPAALEAAVGDVAEAALRHHGLEPLAQRRRAGAAVIGAEIEDRQLALEEPRDDGADRVAVVEQGIAVRGLHPRDLVGERPVVGVEAGAAALLDLVRVWLLALAVERLAGEGGGRAQARRGLARVERGARRVAVDVDDVAGEDGLDGRRRQILREGVEAVDVPVGVGERAADLGQPAADAVGQLGAGMRQAEDQRRAALLDSDGRHLVSSRPGRMVSLPAVIAPAATRARAASMSGAK